MASPFDKMRNDQKTSGEELVRRNLLKSLSLPKKDQDGARGDVHVSRLSDFKVSSTPASAPIRTVDDMTILSDLPTVRTPSLSFSSGMPEGFFIDGQATWIIPVVPPPGMKRVQVPEARDSEVAGYASQLRQLVRSSGIYALASVASPLISLALSPFLAHHLSRADYGLLAVLTTAIALIAGVTQLGLSSAFFRSYNYDYESQRDRLAVLSTVVILLSLSSLLAALTITIGATWLGTRLFSSPSSSDLLKLVGLVVLLQNLTVPGFAWLRAENHPGFFSMLSIANLLVTLSATIVFVGTMQMGIAGALLATGLGWAVVVACTLPFILLRAGLHLRKDIAWGLLTFGVPNIANYVSVWILQLSDRYLLSHLASLAQTASYAVAYSLGGALSVVVIAPFSLAWPSAMFAIAKRDDATHVFQLVFRWYGIVLLFAVFALSLVATIMLNLLFPPAYHSAAIIIPIIAVSIMFFGIYNVFVVGVSLRRKTWLAVIFTTTAALVNIGCNLFLIPRYASIGAAVSTLIAYALLALITYIVNQRLYPIPFEIGKFIIMLFIGVVLFVGSNFLAQFQGTTYRAWGISFATLSVYAGFLLLLGKFPDWKDKLMHRETKEEYLS